jgi:hypothetical protein
MADDLREHVERHLTDGQWHDRCGACHRRREHGGTGVEWLDQLLAAAEQRGRERQRAADVEALRASGDFEFGLAAEFLVSEMPVSGSPEGPEQ